MPHIISQTQVDLDDDELQFPVNTRTVFQERFDLASNQPSLVIVKSHVRSMPSFGKKKKKRSSINYQNRTMDVASFREISRIQHHENQTMKALKASSSTLNDKNKEIWSGFWSMAAKMESKKKRMQSKMDLKKKKTSSVIRSSVTSKKKPYSVIRSSVTLSKERKINDKMGVGEMVLEPIDKDVEDDNDCNEKMGLEPIDKDYEDDEDDENNIPLAQLFEHQRRVNDFMMVLERKSDELKSKLNYDEDDEY